MTVGREWGEVFASIWAVRAKIEGMGAAEAVNVLREPRRR